MKAEIRNQVFFYSCGFVSIRGSSLIAAVRLGRPSCSHPFSLAGHEDWPQKAQTRSSVIFLLCFMCFLWPSVVRRPEGTGKKVRDLECFPCGSREVSSILATFADLVFNVFDTDSETDTDTDGGEKPET